MTTASTGLHPDWDRFAKDLARRVNGLAPASELVVLPKGAGVITSGLLLLTRNADQGISATTSADLLEDDPELRNAVVGSLRRLGWHPADSKPAVSTVIVLPIFRREWGAPIDPAAVAESVAATLHLAYFVTSAEDVEVEVELGGLA